MQLQNYCWLLSVMVLGGGPALSAAPAIDPVANVNVPAGKSLILPVTANSPNGRPLSYTASSSTNAIQVEVHTNNPFWKLSVVQAAATNAPGAFLTPYRGGAVMATNIGDMTFMLLRDIAPRTVDAIAGLTTSGFYNSNTIFHRIVTVPYFIIQGGDPTTNGSGGAAFSYDDEYHPRALYDGSGQLGCAKAGPDGNGSQFFITAAPDRGFDLRYTIFGQLLRGFNVLSNVLYTATNSASRPLADVIITRAAIVSNAFDTVLTLTATNATGVGATIKVVADDGAGGRTTNSFTATTVADSSVNEIPILSPPVVTNRVAPVNGRITNILTAFDFEGNALNWDVGFPDANSQKFASNSTFNATSGQLVIIPQAGYTGPIYFYTAVSQDIFFSSYDYQDQTVVFGDTAITAVGTNFVCPPLVTVSNALLASFTNGVANSAPTNFTASVNWGDNSISSATITTNSAGRKEVRGTHTYTNSGTYPVYLTIRSSLGVDARVISTAIVPPQLTLNRTGPNNAFRWPAEAAEYQLQFTTNLASPTWVTLTNLPVLSGYDTAVTNAASRSNAFYRLKR